MKFSNVIAMGLILVMFFALLGFVGQIEATYTVGNCEVVEISEDIATVEDNRGNQWSFCIDETSELKVGDEVDLVMDNNHTDHTRKDDKIIKVK